MYTTTASGPSPVNRNTISFEYKYIMLFTPVPLYTFHVFSCCNGKTSLQEQKCFDVETNKYYVPVPGRKQQLYNTSRYQEGSNSSTTSLHQYFTTHSGAGWTNGTVAVSLKTGNSNDKLLVIDSLNCVSHLRNTIGSVRMTSQLPPCQDTGRVN